MENTSNKIELYNRYHSDVYLEQIENNAWKLSGDDNALHWIRVGYSDKEDTIAFIDPSGGPFLSVGGKVEGKTISEIKHQKGLGFILTLKDEDS